MFGAELACVFAIFTSQAWNMTFSMYQSMRNVPKDLEEASQSFHLGGWQRFWRLDVPFAMPGLIWNTMMSMSGGWFFVVASEAITVGNTTVTLPGIGSYVALGIQKQNLPAIGYAILTMLLVIIAYDQLLFRPVVAWADKFRFEQTASASAPTSWMLDLFRRTRALARADASVRGAEQGVLEFAHRMAGTAAAADGTRAAVRRRAWSMRSGSHLIIACTGYAAWRIYHYLSATPGPRRTSLAAIGYGFITLVARRRADRAGHADLGAGRGLDRTAAEAGRADPAAGAVSGGLSGQPRLPGLRGRDRPLRPQSRISG